MFGREVTTEESQELFNAILKLKNIEECQMFFRDLCTLKELSDMAERLRVAKKVSNNIPYRKIAEETGSSTATITRVAHWLNHGMGGYLLVLERLKQK